jgi:hypothetical protein
MNALLHPMSSHLPPPLAGGGKDFARSAKVLGEGKIAVPFVEVWLAEQNPSPTRSARAPSRKGRGKAVS